MAAELNSVFDCNVERRRLGGNGEKYDIVDSFCHLGNMLSTEGGDRYSSNSKSGVCMEEIQGAGTLLNVQCQSAMFGC